MKFLIALLLSLVPALAQNQYNYLIFGGTNGQGTNTIVVSAGSGVNVASNYSDGFITFTVSATATEVPTVTFSDFDYTNDLSRRLVMFGDSFMTVGFQNQWLTNQPFFGRGLVTNLAVSGTYTYDIEIAVSNYVGNFRKKKKSDDLYVIINGGGNNLSHSLSNLAQMQNNMSNAWSYATNAGAKLMVMTITQGRGVPAGDEPIRLQYNDWVRTNYLAWNAVLFDAARLLPNYQDTRYFYDQNHPTTNAGIIMGRYAEELFRTATRGPFSIPGTNDSRAWFGLAYNVPLNIGVGGKTNMTLNPGGTTKIAGAAFNNDNSLSVDSDIHVKGVGNRLQFDGHGWVTMSSGQATMFNTDGGRGSLRHGTNRFDGFTGFTPADPDTLWTWLPISINGTNGLIKVILQ